jgi:uncharacterized protein YpmS
LQIAHTTNNPADEIPITTEAVQDLEYNIETAVAIAESSGVVSLVITQEQLSSLVAFQLSDMPEPTINDIQIYLQSGQMVISGTVVQEGMNLPATAIVMVRGDSQGELIVDITSAKVGPIEVPDNMKQLLSQEIENAIESQVRTEAGNLRIDTIQIEDGQMIITGSLN